MMMVHAHELGDEWDRQSGATPSIHMISSIRETKTVNKLRQFWTMSA